MYALLLSQIPKFKNRILMNEAFSRFRPEIEYECFVSIQDTVKRIAIFRFRMLTQRAMRMQEKKPIPVFTDYLKVLKKLNCQGNKKLASDFFF